MNPDENAVNSLRVLSVDMISYARSGHPGIALGAAPIIYSLYAHNLRINPQDPNWPNRDRFVLSAGHASSLLYAMLFMAGYDVSIDDLVEFRKIGSKTPGHPEYGVTPGVEVSTGSLGEGFANAVGMAISEKYLSQMVEDEVIEKSKQTLVNYYVYCLVSDGDLMEGVVDEAASLAGFLGLDNLIVLYDSNDVTLDGPISKSSNINMVQKFINYGWEVDFVPEGNEVKEIDKAIERAKINRRPTLIEIKTVIGRGSEHEGKNNVHGKPLTREDVQRVRRKYNVTTNAMEITEEPVLYVRNLIKSRVSHDYNKWKTDFENAKNNGPTEKLKTILDFIEKGKDEIKFSCKNFKIQNDYNEELRESNSKIMNIISEKTKFFLGGSADLSSSCHTYLYKEIDFTKREKRGRNFCFGVREHAMASILNGVSLSGIRTFASTFLVYADYVKPALRMTCMMNLPVTYIFTHDSVRIGEDGPSHQPIEQLAMLRTTPNLVVIRPADINEVIGSWDYIVNNRKPVALILAKDEAHILAGTSGEKVYNGAYVVRGEQNRLDAVLVSTGIDLTMTYLISEELRSKGIDTRVVSMPSMELFYEQPIEYQNSVIPPNAKVITVEASATLPWYKVASKGCAIGIDEFGYSGRKDDVLEKVHFDYASVLAKVESCIRQ